MSGKVEVNHPYYPKDLKLPHYVPNDKGLLEILGLFFGIVAVFVIATWVFTSSLKKPKFSVLERIILCWLVACGIIHTVLEGYFGIFHETLASDMSHLGQMWKEYSLGDSRYLSSDTFMVCMERITAFVDGPLCFITILAFLKNSPYRYVFLLIVSLCQLYGDSLYFLTEIQEDFSHGHMWHPLYFWVYFGFLNSLWIIIPSCLIVHASIKLGSCQSFRDARPEGSKVKNNTKNNKKKK